MDATEDLYNNYPAASVTAALNKLCNVKKSLPNFISIRDHPLSTYAKFSEKLTFLTP